MPGVDQRIDRLYGLPLAEFTAARNELARELKREGSDRAEEVRRLAKPPAPVWAINQAARADRAAVKELVAAAAALRKAQERALARPAAAAALRAAQERERGAIRRLAEAAASALGGAAAAQRERIERTLAAAALDGDARRELQAGRLTREVAPAGFEALAGMKLPPPRPPARKASPPKKPKPDPREQRRRRLERRLAAAQKVVDDLRAQLEQL